MPEDYFTMLGLSPGTYSSSEIARRYLALRERLGPALESPATQEDARRAIDQLHVAYTALRDPDRQAQVRAALEGADPLTRLRLHIAASLEDGLLRYSRREAVLALARRLGFSEFQAQLIIAHVQYGDDPLALPFTAKARPSAVRRLAAVGGLAVVMFAVLLEWALRV